MMTIGTLVAGRYEIRDRLGQGSQGQVLEAFDRQLGRLVALKILPICGSSTEERAERRRRFQTEARAAARLQHPGIVAIFDSGETEDEAWIAMELVIGQTLRDALRVPGRLPLREALRIGRELLDALQAAHARGVIHRDVKPCNIMLAMDAGDGHGRVRLTDFGIASLVVGQRPGEFEFVGTPSVMAPEQIRGEACDERTDLWSAGVVLYELLTGIPPFAGGVPAIYSAVLAREPLPPTLLNPDLPLGFDAVLKTALAKSIDRRFPSAEAMAAAIDAAAGDLLDSRMAAIPPQGGSIAPPRAARSGGASTALAFLAGAAVASAGFVWRDAGWRGWPSHPVVAAALHPDTAVRPEADAHHPAAKVEEPATNTPPVAPFSAEPLPAAADLATTERPAPVTDQAPAILAAAPLTEPAPGVAAAPDEAPILAEVPMAVASPSVPEAEPEPAPVLASPAAPEPLPALPQAEASVAPVGEPALTSSPSGGAPDAGNVAAAALPPRELESVGPVAEPTPPATPVAARAVEAPVTAPAVATDACVGRAPQFATGNHPGFGRVVLRWSQPVRYRATAKPGGIRLEFAEPFCIAIGPAAALPRNVRAVAGTPGVIEIDAAPGATIRHFTLDRRTVIDIADAQRP
jgi:serine/threonine-protein kinase